MSRTLVNPKTGKWLSGVPDNSICCTLLGRICYVMNSIYETSSDCCEDFYQATLPYEATAKECRKIARALLNVPDKKLREVYSKSGSLMHNTFTFKHLRMFATRVGKYLRRLKYGYISAGDECYTIQQRYIHKIMPTAKRWKVTSTEEKFRAWLEIPNPEFPGRMAPIDFLDTAVQSTKYKFVLFVHTYIKNKIKAKV